MAEPDRRRTLEETWDFLSSEGMEITRDDQGRPLVAAKMPSFDDEELLGLNFFKGQWLEMDFANLTLPRTFFGRSLFERVAFHDSSLSESRMCWNDFIACDFSRADLSDCDMRASTFTNCKFIGSILKGADLRQSRFEGCDFGDAKMTGAVANRPSAEVFSLRHLLSKAQRDVIIWHDDLGPEPLGG